jgi:hypothetical protein
MFSISKRHGLCFSISNIAVAFCKLEYLILNHIQKRSILLRPVPSAVYAISARPQFSELLTIAAIPTVFAAAPQS